MRGQVIYVVVVVVVVWVLKRLEDARRDGDPILALLPDSGEEHEPLAWSLRDGCSPLTPLLGNPHAASGLLHAAAAAIACAKGRALGQPVRAISLQVEAMEGQASTLLIARDVDGAALRPGRLWRRRPRSRSSSSRPMRP